MIVISLDNRTKARGILENAGGELAAIGKTTASAIESLANTFRVFARHAETIMGLTADIVSCVQSESFGSLVPNLQNLGPPLRL